MDKSTLASIVSAEVQAAMGRDGSELADQRSTAMDYYLGEPYGDEVEGRSQVVTTDVSDTVEAALPQILKVFTSTERAVLFEPTGPEDEEQAEQETEYVNYVFYKKNDGFNILYTFCKDGLLQKNSIVKVFPEEITEVTKEPYESLSEPDLTLLLSDQDVELTGEPEQNENGLYSVEIQRTTSEKVVRVENIPPEEFVTSKNTRKVDLSEADFCAHRCRKTVSDLLRMGFSEKELKDIGNTKEGATEEEISRYHLDDEHPEMETQPRDPSMREIWVIEAYIRVDFDEDGIAELRKVLLAGNVVLLNEEIDHVPFISFTPVQLNHKFYGLSLADLTMDLQKQKSALLRQILDNLYLINNSRHTVVDGQVNISDLLISRPGGIVRQNAPGMVDTLKTQPFSGHAFNMLEYLDTTRETRTGITRYNQGLDANSLNKTATGINRIMDASQQRLELIARLFGESVKKMMLLIHKLTLQYPNKQEIIRIRNKFVPVDPSEWKHRSNMTVTVGLGTGSREQKLQSYSAILQIQKEMFEMGGADVMVSLKNIYNTAAKIAESSGEMPEMFFLDPGQEKMPQQQGPSPEEQALQAQMQIEQNKIQVQMQELQLDKEKVLGELQIKQQELELKIQQLALKEQEIAAETTVDAARQDLTKYEIDKKAETELEIARMNLEAQKENMKQAGENAAKESKESKEPKAAAPPTINVTIEKDGAKKIDVERDGDGKISGAKVSDDG